MPDLEMALLALKSRSFLFLFRNYFYFRFWSPPMSADVDRCRPMSGHVGNARSRPGVVKNMAVAVEIASASLSVQKLLILLFLAAAMLDFPLPVLPEIA
jgi:hypothetical protein